MKNKNFIESFKNALFGLKLAFGTERNFRFDIFCGIVVLALGFVLDFSYVELAILLITIFIVLISEVINTAIEKTVDLATDEFKPLAKAAKDIAAGAVLLSSFMSIIIGVLLFFKKSVLIKILIFFNWSF